ncbi:RND multidrug efflux transporter; Acriflavin resistance protein [hydrothermal vent metagenome]|uniref:RND multidrug efflux transporter Acriflavin resistance protein n=1 Tax=hydrothermal vent metagenome TaxID=652676 RepID=A0A3B0ZQP8_9ZZZZ
MSAIKLYLTSFADNPLDTVAQQIIAQQKENLPQLTNTIVFTAQTNLASELRYKLLNSARQHNVQALLGPQIIAMQQWLQSFQPADIKVVNNTTQELILVEALLQYPDILGEANPWVYAHSLLNLFHELTANKIQPQKNEQDFVEQISLAYGLPDKSKTTIEALGREAHFVYTLWQAWHKQLIDYAVVDSQTALLLCMENAAKEFSTKETIDFYLLGYEQLTQTECQWLEKLSQQHNVHYFLQGQQLKEPTDSKLYHPDTHITECIQKLSVDELINVGKQAEPARLEFLNTVYNTQNAPLIERVQAYKNKKPTPLKGLHVFSANDAEQEARAIDIQLRRWLLEGKTKLAIVTENRRLARRVRALLERSGVHLQDAAGWALSTTRAATLVERWLECIEQDFDYLALLDLLKSPFIFPEYDRDTLHYAVYRLEQDIMRHENISRHLENYRNSIINRQDRLPNWFEKNQDTGVLNEVLQKLETAAEPLLQLSQQEKITPPQFIQAIVNSFKILGLTESLANDAAGIEIINLLETLTIDSGLVQLKFNWSEARAWLALQLERSRFMPPASTTQVQLIGLSQSQLQKFDGLIIAAVEEEFLPGSPSPAAFFNDRVKYELGLNTSLQEKNERFYHFTRLLNASDNVLLSYRSQGDNGEEIKPSAWLALLEQFYQLAFDIDLQDETLQALVNSPENTFTHTASELAKQSHQPTPSMPENLIPEKISASQYQELMNCPYLFYAARGLKLEATDEIRQALSKADYGERIHQCLQAFHDKTDDLPGPFKAKVTLHNRDAATKVLSDIIQKVFSADLTENHEHQAWYLQAQKIVPHYIDWQIKHQQDWDIYKAEQTMSKELQINNSHKPLKLKGRLDRIDKNTEGLEVIDYKTGVISSNKNVETGEQVQLPFYHTLLQDDEHNVTQVEYLEVKSDSVKTKAKLTGEKLETIAEESAERLKEIFSQLHTQTGLPAWGNEKTCGHCNMQGICRRQMWQDSQ